MSVIVGFFFEKSSFGKFLQYAYRCLHVGNSRSFYVFWQDMGVFLVIGVLIGIGIGYGVFYFRYEHRQSIDELRGNFTKVQEERDHLRDEVQEYTEQNKILKSKAQMLLDQNEDYAKVVSELSRYYYILRK